MKSVPILEMHCSFAFLGLLVVIFAVNGAYSFPVNAEKNQTPVCDEEVVCNCNYNVNPRSLVSGEIRELKTEMEQLISLVNKTLSSTPWPPGKGNLSGFLKMDRSFYNQCFVNLPLGFILFAAVPESLCKEQHEKYK